MEDSRESSIIDDALRLAHEMDILTIVAENIDDNTVNWCYFPGLGNDE